MKRFAAVVGGLLALCLFVLGGMFAWGRLRPPTAEQIEALSLLARPSQPTQGRNAFSALFFSNVDVPADKIDQVYAAERPRALHWLTFDMLTATPEHWYKPAVPYPSLPRPVESDGLCLARDQHCLAKVRQNQDTVRASLARHHVRLEHERALAGYDYVWSDLTEGPTADFLVSSSDSRGLWSTSAALDFVDGKFDRAFDSVCTQIETRRRLRKGTNASVVNILGGMTMSQATHLFADMLSEAPEGQPLPASCTRAFSPLTVSDVDRCALMQFDFNKTLSPDLWKADLPWTDRWKMSLEHSRRLAAPRYAAACSEAGLSRLLMDQPITPGEWFVHPDAFDAVSNSFGIVLMQIGAPMHESTLNRDEDIVASLRMGATILWLAQHPAPGQSLDQRLAARPAWMHVDDSRHLRVSDDGRSLLISPHGPGSGWVDGWSLPKER
ncbi:hypothetical protein FHW69_001853 [Luteibacter sp. Sphag1AF]|uniref:hypothetical protein n=1 Tax=Luteibacter sp. Sphag1AF TaxID=2587031 RepID=UPI0016218F46|nr:hypothetical protein [Luteibacter sp. Sphag1AF]MBB3227252.1 hypothetical protein [Luteibacter sp. Sphag1AF]